MPDAEVDVTGCQPQPENVDQELVDVSLSTPGDSLSVVQQAERLEYIADMADELAALAVEAGDDEIALKLRAASRRARYLASAR